MMSLGAAWLLWIVVFIIVAIVVRSIWFCGHSWAVPVLIGAIISFLVVVLALGFSYDPVTDPDRIDGFSLLIFIAFLAIVFAASWALLSRGTSHIGVPAFVKDCVEVDCATGQTRLVKRTVSDGCRVLKTKYTGTTCGLSAPVAPTTSGCMTGNYQAASYAV